MNKVILFTPLFLLSLTAFSQKPFSLCPDSAGVDHCKNLDELEEKSRAEFDRTNKLSKPQGADLSMKRNLPSSIILIDSLKKLIKDEVQLEDKLLILSLCNSIIEKNYIASQGMNGTTRSFKTMIPQIKNLVDQNFNKRSEETKEKISLGNAKEDDKESIPAESAIEDDGITTEEPPTNTSYTNSDSIAIVEIQEELKIIKESSVNSRDYSVINIVLSTVILLALGYLIYKSQKRSKGKKKEQTNNVGMKEELPHLKTLIGQIRNSQDNILSNTGSTKSQIETANSSIKNMHLAISSLTVLAEHLQKKIENDRSAQHITANTSTRQETGVVKYIHEPSDGIFNLDKAVDKRGTRSKYIINQIDDNRYHLTIINEEAAIEYFRLELAERLDPFFEYEESVIRKGIIKDIKPAILIRDGENLVLESKGELS